MSEPFLAEIRLMSFNFAPKGWAMCNGQLLPINQNQALFSLLGTTYGGDGRVNFGLPDYRSRVPIHVGPGYNLGQRGGEQTHLLSQAEMPQHIHQAMASTNDASTDSPANSLVLATASIEIYRPPAAQVPMDPAIVGSSGGSQAHENMSPYLTLTFCIALQGIFPSRN